MPKVTMQVNGRSVSGEVEARTLLVQFLRETLDMTGTQIKTMLEQQWLNQVNPRILHVSQGFTYSWDAARPAGSRVVEGSIKLNGVPLTPQGKYRVAMNEFLASGGDGFVVIKEATNRQFAMGDADAMEEYVTASSPLAPPKLDRIQKLN